MQQVCTQCSASFVITPDDLAFYDKVSPMFAGKKEPIPPPTLCPDCRQQRRLAWRNERVLYRRECDLTKREIISSYPPDAPFPVFHREAWFSDDWDPLAYGRDIDFSQSLFKQCTSLLQAVPRAGLNGKNAENCDYCNFCFDSRNCYLSHCCYYSESLLNCYWSLNSRDCVDCSYIFESERCHQCSDCNHSYRCKECILCHTCTDCVASYDCRGCTSCFGCVGLRQKKFCLFNEQLKEGEYSQRVAGMNLQDPQQMKDLHERVTQLKERHPCQCSIQDKTEYCVGDYVFESQNCHQAFQVFRSRDCVHVQDADDIQDCRDAYYVGWSQLLYEAYSAVRLQSSCFFSQCWDGDGLLYCDTCQSCSDCFGCIGLRHMQYCILNKQYSKEEYEALVPKIIEKMRADGEWGEFFPVTMSPFAYNETVAQEYFPMTKEEVLARGWRWREQTDEMPKVDRVIPAAQLPDAIDDIPDDILNWAIECDATKRPFKIIKQELEFYRSMKLPVPRLHPDERHRRRMALRNPRKLWTRHCMKCQKEIETSYAPERPEIVYCEECYLQEVY